MIDQALVERIAGEVSAQPEQVAAAIQLFDKGATPPFVARYRKDATGGLDEPALERIEERNTYNISLCNRRAAILENIAKQDKLTDALRARIEACHNHIALEDCYLPFKKQRRSKASLAREQGLQPLADYLMNQTYVLGPIEMFAEGLVRPERAISSPEEALAGAQNILAEQFSMDADVRDFIRQKMLEEGVITTAATKNAAEQKGRFEAFHQFSEAAKSIAAGKLLTILRGVRMGQLRMDLAINDQETVDALVARIVKDPGSDFAQYIKGAMEDAYKHMLRPAIENEAIGILRERADEEAIDTIREGVERQLMQPAAGRIPVLGILPGLRMGAKIAAVDAAGALLEHTVVFPAEPTHDLDGARQAILELIKKHGIRAIAIAEAAGSRDAAKAAGQALQELDDKRAFMVFVAEAPAEAHSMSKAAKDEFPDLDPAIRNAIAIARLLQDPLAELVKVEPKHFATGQHLHDVNQRRLRDVLNKAVVSCVCRIGAAVNTASPDLLRYVGGIQLGAAQNIIEARTKNGPFKNRIQLAEVPGIGEKTFEQSAGFLIIHDGENPLDATMIHPEAYEVVEKIAASVGADTASLIGNAELIGKADFSAFATGNIGPMALADIREQLLRPGANARRPFKAPRYIHGVYDVQDLEEGMEAEGVVTNITEFGAFVDIGVQQDGLIHLSELANRFIRNPHDIIQVGDLVRVKVIKVDKNQRRISLSRKALLPPPRPRTPRPQRPAAPENMATSAAPDGATPEDAAKPHRDTAHRPRREDSQDRRRRDGHDDRQGSGRDRRDREGAGPRREERMTPAARRSAGAGPDKSKKGKPFRDKPGRGAPAFRGDSDDRLANTMLADQLAALKEKFKS